MYFQYNLMKTNFEKYLKFGFWTQDVLVHLLFAEAGSKAHAGYQELREKNYAGAIYPIRVYILYNARFRYLRYMCAALGTADDEPEKCKTKSTKQIERKNAFHYMKFKNYYQK